MPEQPDATSAAQRVPGGLRPSESGYFIDVTLRFVYATDSGAAEHLDAHAVGWTRRPRVAEQARLRLLSCLTPDASVSVAAIGVAVGDDETDPSRARRHASIRDQHERADQGTRHDCLTRIAAAARSLIQWLEAEADAGEARERIVTAAWRRVSRLVDLGADESAAVTRRPPAGMVADVGQVLAAAHAILDAPWVDPAAFAEDELIRWRADGRARLLAFQEAAAPMLRWAVEYDCLDGEVSAGVEGPRFPMAATWMAWAAVGRGATGYALEALLHDAANELIGVRGALQMELAGERTRVDRAAGQTSMFGEADGNGEAPVDFMGVPGDPYRVTRSLLDRVLAKRPTLLTGPSASAGNYYVWARAPGAPEAKDRTPATVLLAKAGGRAEAERLITVLSAAHPPAATDGLPTFATFPADAIDDAERILLDVELGEPADADYAEFLRGDAGRCMAAMREAGGMNATSPNLTDTINSLSPEALDVLAAALAPETRARLTKGRAAGGERKRPPDPAERDRQAAAAAADIAALPTHVVRAGQQLLRARERAGDPRLTYAKSHGYYLAHLYDAKEDGDLPDLGTWERYAREFLKATGQGRPANEPRYGRSGRSIAQANGASASAG